MDIIDFYFHIPSKATYLGMQRLLISRDLRLVADSNKPELPNLGGNRGHGS